MEANKNFKVTISAHTKNHAFRLAEGLAARNILHYVYTIYPHFKLASYHIPTDHIRTFSFLGALKYLNIRLGNIVANLDDWNSHVFERLVALDLKDPGGPWVFHGLSGYCEKSMRKAKKLGGITVVDRACPHIDFQQQAVAEEKSRLLGRKVLPEKLGTYEQMKREYDLADYIVVPSRYSQNSFLERGYSASKIRLVPLCNEKTTLPPAGAKRSDKFTVLCIGGHFYRKGIYYLLQAWRKLNLKDAELLLRSDIPKEFPELMNVPGVTYLPRVSEEEIIKLYERPHIFVLPSMDEGFGMVTVEALAAGLPVIVTDHVGSADVLDEGKDGFIVPARNTEALAERIKFFYDHPGKAREMGEQGILKAKEYSHARYADRMIDAYAQMISDKITAQL